MLLRFVGCCCRLHLSFCSPFSNTFLVRSAPCGGSFPHFQSSAFLVAKVLLSGGPWGKPAVNRLLRATSLDMIFEGLDCDNKPDKNAVYAALTRSCSLTKRSLCKEAPDLAKCLRELAIEHFAAESGSVDYLSGKIFLSWVGCLRRLNLLEGHLLHLLDTRFWLQLGEWTGKEFAVLLTHLQHSSQWTPSHECLHIAATELADRMASDGVMPKEACLCLKILVLDRRYYTTDLISSSKDFLLRHQEHLSAAEIEGFSWVYSYVHEPDAFQVLNRVVMDKIGLFTANQLEISVSCAAHSGAVLSAEFLDHLALCSEAMWSHHSIYNLAELAEVFSRYGRHRPDVMQRIIDVAVKKINLNPVAGKAFEKLLNAAVGFPGVKVEPLCKAVVSCLKVGANMTVLSHCIHLLGKAGALTPHLNQLVTRRLLAMSDVDVSHITLVLWALMRQSGMVDEQLLLAWHRVLTENISVLLPQVLLTLLTLYSQLPEQLSERVVLLKAVEKRVVEENSMLGWDFFVLLSYQLARNGLCSETLGAILESKARSLEWQNQLSTKHVGMLLLVLHRLQRLTEDICKDAVDEYCIQLSGCLREDHIRFLRVLSRVDVCSPGLLNKTFETLSSFVRPLNSMELYDLYNSAVLRSDKLTQWVTWLQLQLRTFVSDLKLVHVLRVMKLLRTTVKEARDWELWSLVENRVVLQVNDLDMDELIMSIVAFYGVSRYRCELLDGLEHLLCNSHSFPELTLARLNSLLDYCIVCRTAGPLLHKHLRVAASQQQGSFKTQRQLKMKLAMVSETVEVNHRREEDGAVFFAWKNS